MRFPLPANTFPPLALTANDARELAVVAEDVVKKTVDEYIEHLMAHVGVVDERRWKKIKQRGDVRVFRERGTGRHAHADSEEYTVIAPLLSFGTLEGSLDDVMYGVITPTTESMQLRTAYVEDSFVDWGVLASLIEPSEDDPFRELNVKWLVKGHPWLIGTVARVRDVLYIVSSGFAMTPSGERIGYHMKHTVEIPEIRELDEYSIVRAAGSACYIFRQRGPNCVEMYYRGFFSPQGNVNAAITAASSAEISVAAWKNSYCADMKKLERVLSSCRSSSSSSSVPPSSGIGGGCSSDDGSSVSGDTSASYSTQSAISRGDSTSCSRCKESISNTKFKVSRTSWKEKHCAVCSQPVCKRCRVQKTVFLSSPSRVKELTPVTKTVCTLCMARIVNSSSAAFAVLDVRAARGEFVDYMEALADM